MYHSITCQTLIHTYVCQQITLGKYRENYQYTETSNNRTLVHGHLAMQILSYATKRKAESTVSGDWKMELEHQSPLVLGAISVTVQNIW